MSRHTRRTAASTEDTEAATLGHRYVEEFPNTGDEHAATEPLDEGVVAHQLGVETDRVGRDAVVVGIVGFRETVPDWELQVDDVVADGNRVMLRATVRGTPQRPWGTLVPTGRSFGAAAFFGFRVEDGRMAEQWNPVNLAGIGRQLELIPPTPRTLVAMARHRLVG